MTRALNMSVGSIPASWLARTGALCVLLAAAGCLGEAPHGNLLDPETDGYREVGAVSGRVTRFYPPHEPLAGAEVRLTPESSASGGAFVVRAGADGRFAFVDVPVGRYRVEAGREGYAAALDSVTVDLGTRVDRELRLDGLPVVDGLSLRTVHVSRWWPQEDLYLLEVTADVQDPDGPADVAAVWLEAPGSGFTRALQPTQVPGRFQVTVPADSLPGGSLHALMGRPFVVTARDHVGLLADAEARTLARIIEETPVPEAPQALTTVDTQRPVLTWEPADLPFPFTYRVDVVQVFEFNIHTVVQTVDAIPPTATTLQVPAPLPRGTYYWTLSVVDTFGNRSRSKEAGFQVE